MSQFPHPVRLWDRLKAWPVESQLGARRNAMVASTTLTARRAEREDVEAYLSARTAARTPAPLAATRVEIAGS